jgi:hypothetical protein
MLQVDAATAGVIRPMPREVPVCRDCAGTRVFRRSHADGRVTHWFCHECCEIKGQVWMRKAADLTDFLEEVA